MFAAIQQAQGNTGITLSRVLGDIPHDGGAILVYAMLAVFAVLIWLGSRSSGSTPRGSDPSGPQATNAG